MVNVTRGDIVLCDLNPVIGTEQSGLRPVVIVQSDRANRVSPHTIIAPFTTKIRRALLPLTGLTAKQVQKLQKLSTKKSQKPKK
jgi:mRNA-degrading endonuclease toxin of MazEF toxin-antitoxin module